MVATIAALILTWNGGLPANEMAQHLVLIEQRGGPPAHIMYGLICVESEWDPTCVGAHGETGLTQIHWHVHPGAPRAGWTAQMDWSAAHLMGLKKRAGSWEVALAAYNGGWGGRKWAQCRKYARVVLKKAKGVEAHGSR